MGTDLFWRKIPIALNLKISLILGMNVYKRGVYLSLLMPILYFPSLYQIVAGIFFFLLFFLLSSSDAEFLLFQS